MGITVKLVDNKKALIGNCCAEAYFGKDAYRRVEKDLKAQEDKVYYIEAIRPLEAKLDLALLECDKLEPLLRELDLTYNNLKKRFPAQMEALQHAAYRNHGRLTYDRRTVNFSAIERGTGNKILYVNEIMGVIGGSEFLIKKERLITYLSRLRAEVLGARTRLLRKTDRTTEMRAILMMVQNSCRQAIRLVEFYEAGLEFFTLDNFVLITNWLERRGRDQIYVAPFKETSCRQPMLSETKFHFEKPTNNLVELLSYQPN
jgi:hypothetical protein